MPTFVGTPNRDEFVGTPGDDVFFGGGGADLLIGNEGADRFIYTDWSDSRPFSGDRIVDFISGQDQLDFLGFPGLRDLIILPSFNAATILGMTAEGPFTLRLDRPVALSDLILPSGLNARIATTSGSSSDARGVLYQGPAGNYLFMGNTGGAPETIDSNSLPSPQNPDVIVGGLGGDTITGHTRDWLFGFEGRDRLIAGLESNGRSGVGITLTGGAGGDTFVLSFGVGAAGGAITDFTFVGADSDTIVISSATTPGPAGRTLYVGDTSSGVRLSLTPFATSEASYLVEGVRWESLANRITDAAGAPLDIRFSILGGPQGDRLQGTDGPDDMAGFGDIDFLFGGGGDDTMSGGEGDDRLDGGTGFDVADYSTGTSAVTVNLSLTTAQNTGGAGADTLTSIEGVRGSVFADVLTGNDLANLLSGGAGNDTLRGGNGNDALDGGAGFDVAVYASVRRQYEASSTTVSGGGEGTDALTSIEEARFIDGGLTFDPASASAQVMRLYSAALNRGPDQAGLEANVANVGRIGLQAVANTFVASSEFQARFGALNNQQFVEQLYVFALGRDGDRDGIATWVGALNAGTSRGQIVLAFSDSLEHQARTAATLSAGLWVPDAQAQVIARMYDATFDRLPDVGGLASWTAALKGGTPLIDIATAFSGSSEFQARYGAVSNEQFVRQMYQFCLNREPDAGGLAGWVNALNTSTSRAQMLLNFSESAEHIALTAAAWLGGIRFQGYVGASQDEPGSKGPDVALVLPGMCGDDAFVPPGVAWEYTGVVSDLADYATAASKPAPWEIALSPGHDLDTSAQPLFVDHDPIMPCQDSHIW